MPWRTRSPKLTVVTGGSFESNYAMPAARMTASCGSAERPHLGHERRNAATVSPPSSATRWHERESLRCGTEQGSADCRQCEEEGSPLLHRAAVGRRC